MLHVFALLAICTGTGICSRGDITASCLTQPHTKHTIVCQDAVDDYGLIPGKGCLRKIPIRRFSICSGVLLLGALKRPTEPA